MSKEFVRYSLSFRQLAQVIGQFLHPLPAVRKRQVVLSAEGLERVFYYACSIAFYRVFLFYHAAELGGESSVAA